MAWIAVKTLQKRRHAVHLAARTKGAKHLSDGLPGVLQVFEDSLAVNGVDGSVSVRQPVGVADHLDVLGCLDVEVDEVRMNSTGPAAHREAEIILIDL